MPRTLPMYRSECEWGPRPCPHITCRHHLLLEVYGGNQVRENHPDATIYDLAETCSLDVANKGGLVLDQVGDLLGVTRERVRQIEASALRKIRRHPDYREAFGLGATMERHEVDGVGSSADWRVSDLEEM